MIELCGDYDQDELFRFVGQRVGTAPEAFAPGAGAGLLSDGALVGGVVFHSYRILSHGSFCSMAAACDDAKAVTRGIIRKMLFYPFCQLKVRRLQAETSVENDRCRSILERMGFKLDGVLRRGHDGTVDQAVYSLLPEECRWI